MPQDHSGKAVHERKTGKEGLHKIAAARPQVSGGRAAGSYAEILFRVVGLGLLLGRSQTLEALEQLFFAHVLGDHRRARTGR